MASKHLFIYSHPGHCYGRLSCSCYGDGVGGWTIKFDYQAWTTTIPRRVNGTGFKECSVPPANEAPSTGNDEITLATPGNKWFICGVAKHCANGGQKLSITVSPVSPSSPSTNAANGIFISGFRVLALPTDRY
ncbi:hypothetical protein HHK36_011555 [Tetracentron sinense]|uniref:Phytocyanin domain-containing protein n=1 Tax=Tetracentron sinense TaxID=13715 RepID=A0A834ZBY7_TETSI|nr:hypothetical protein HHK36_011555 [Tetracentron sinense]